MKKLHSILLITVIGLTSITFTSCKKEGCTNPNANNYNEEAKKDDGSCIYPIINMNAGTSGDLSGGGGTASGTQTFTQNSETLGWDMSIDATSGSFQLVVRDADGEVVIDKTLTAGSGAQDASGTSSIGTTGTWTTTVILTDFNGVGDYSFQ